MLMASKLGPHCVTPTATARRMIEAGCRVVKLLDDFGLAELANAKGALVIGRSFSPFTAESQRDQAPADAALRFVNSQREIYRLNPAVKIWEGHNEPVWSSAEDMQWYAQFEIARLNLLSQIGLRGVIGNFSTGLPDLSLWLHFVPALREAIRLNGYLGLHEYSAPWMWWLTGRFQVNPNEDAGGFGWTTLRYRQVMRELPSDVRLRVRILITECGLDRIAQVRPGMATGNWRTCAEWWTAENSQVGPVPYNADHERYYADQLAWYDHQLQLDGFVVGATVFTVGHNNPAWTNHDIDGTRVAEHLIEHIRAEAAAGTPPPTPTPEPPPPTGDSMSIEIASLDFLRNYLWDARPGAPEPGNTIFIPFGMGFDYVNNPATRVIWQDIKIGSPTFGQMRTSDSQFLKPEVVIRAQAQMPDIPFPVGVTHLIKGFKGWGPIWVLYVLALNVLQGAKYRLTWPVWPNLLTSDEGGNKIYADDPAAGWLRLKVKSGEVDMKIDPSKSPDNTWYNGRDFAYGHWFSPQVVIDATAPVMTIGLECVSIFGLKDSDFMIAPPTLEMIAAPGGDNPGSGEPPPVAAGTLRGLVAAVRESAGAALAGVQQVDEAARSLSDLVG